MDAIQGENPALIRKKCLEVLRDLPQGVIGPVKDTRDVNIFACWSRWAFGDVAPHSGLESMNCSNLLCK